MTRASAMIIAFVAITALELGAPSALAQSLSHWPRQCRTDISRTCHDVAKQEDRAILTCLQENETRLSQRCRKLLQTYGHVPDNPGKNPSKRR